MKTRTSLIWTCSIILSIVESCNPQKLNVHWSPQSMMYLKGKYGKRFVLEDDSSVLQSFSALLRGIQRLNSPAFRKPPNIVSLEKVLVRYLQR